LCPASKSRLAHFSMSHARKIFKMTHTLITPPQSKK
jgi:hypothetical protein